MTYTRTLLEEQLERLIDQHGLAMVIDTVANVCGHKECHIAETWQDETTARLWSQASVKIGNAADYCIRLGLDK